MPHTMPIFVLSIEYKIVLAPHDFTSKFSGGFREQHSGHQLKPEGTQHMPKWQDCQLETVADVLAMGTRQMP